MIDHRRRARWRLAKFFRLATLTVAATLTLAPSAAQAAQLAASDGDQELIVFSSDDPWHNATLVPLLGMLPGEQVLGLDTRPLNGDLYLLGSSSRIYVVNARTGVVAPLGPGPFAPVLNGRAFGFDFNPTVDRIRVVSDVDQNLRLIPAGVAGEGTVASTDASLNYPVEDAGFGFDPRAAAAAYDNNDNDPATGTTLYDIDTERDVLVKQAPPNNGTLVTIGPLGEDFTDLAGFDVAPDGTAWAVLQLGPKRASRLYTIDLTTGLATSVGRVKGGRGLTSLAVLFGS